MSKSSFEGFHSNLKKKTNIKSGRNKTHLNELTKKFKNYIDNANDGIIHLDIVSEILKAPKRRIYDVANVLEGIGLLQKSGKKNIMQWTGKSSLYAEDKVSALKREINVLALKENVLDQLNNWAQEKLQTLQADKKLAYVTHSDVRSIPVYKDRTIIVLKASPEATVTLSQPVSNSGQSDIPLLVRPSVGEIEIFLCSDNSDYEANDSTMEEDNCDEQGQKQGSTKNRKSAETGEGEKECLSPWGTSDVLCHLDDFNFIIGDDFQLPTEDLDVSGR